MALANVERLDNGSTDGSLARGLHRETISGVGNTTVAYQLKPGDSGALCLFDAADGVVYTLPEPVVGMQFDFLVTVAGTSNSYSINTDAATTFIGGGVGSFSTTVAEGGDSFAADIASTVSIDLDADTTGRLVGTHLTLTCTSATTWVVSGNIHGVGTLATPFA